MQLYILNQGSSQKVKSMTTLDMISGQLFREKDFISADSAETTGHWFKINLNNAKYDAQGQGQRSRSKVPLTYLPKFPTYSFYSHTKAKPDWAVYLYFQISIIIMLYHALHLAIFMAAKNL